MSNINFNSFRKEMNNEERKVLTDYVKHLNTLSTGSVLIMIAFLEKLFKDNPKSEEFVIVSIASFLISIVGGILVYTITLYQNDNLGSKFRKVLFNAAAIGIILLWIGFLIGIISLGVFGIINLSTN